MKKAMKWVSLLLAIMVITSGCSTNSESSENAENVAIPVVVQKVEKKSLDKSERYIGLLSAKNDVMVLPKATGKVKEVYVSQGEDVEKDQVLMKLDDEDMQNALSQAEAGYQAALSNLTQAKEGKSSGILNAELQLEQAEDAYKKAKENYEQMKKLYEDEVISKSQLDQAESSFIQAESGLKLAKNGLESAKSNASIAALESQVEQAKLGVQQARRALDNTKITAPIAGKISSIMVEIGEMAGPQSPIAQIINQTQMTVKLNITETQLSNFVTGKAVKVRVPSLDKNVNGTTTFIAPAANSQTLTFPVEINVDNTDQGLRAGMHVEVLITTSTGKDQLIVPTAAVLGSENDNYVFIVNGKKAEKRKVKVKEMNTSETIIETGLTVNDLVIIKGQYDLENNTPIDVVRNEGKAS